MSLDRLARLVVCVAALVHFAPSGRADEPQAPSQPVAPKPAVPPLSDDVKELLEFVKGLDGATPKTRAEREAIARAPRRDGRSYAAIEAAVEKIHRIATEEDKKLPGYDTAMGLRLVFRTMLLGDGPRGGTPEQRAELIQEIAAALAASPTPSRGAVTAAMKVGNHFELRDPPRAVEIYRQYGNLLAKCTDPEAADAGAKMLAAAMRLDLVGKPLEITGTVTDGTTFDWTAYRGKVVLVDFWATWCGPCHRELPNIKKSYQQYHEQGFEVVGISVDEDRQALDGYLQKEPLPWSTLHDGDLEKNPNAKRYGVMGIPCMILVDRAGRVVSTDARGAELTKHLEALFPAEEPEKR